MKPKRTKEEEEEEEHTAPSPTRPIARKQMWDGASSHGVGVAEAWSYMKKSGEAAGEPSAGKETSASVETARAPIASKRRWGKFSLLQRQQDARPINSRAVSNATDGDSEASVGPSPDDLFTQGTAAFQQGEYATAKDKWSLALLALPRDPTLYSNRSAAWLAISIQCEEEAARNREREEEAREKVAEMTDPVKVWNALRSPSPSKSNGKEEPVARVPGQPRALTFIPDAQEAMPLADDGARAGGGLLSLMKAKGLVAAAAAPSTCSLSPGADDGRGGSGGSGGHAVSSPPPSPPPPPSPSQATKTSTALALLTTPPRVVPNPSTALTTGTSTSTSSPKARWKLAVQQAVAETPTPLANRSSAWDQLKSKLSDRKDTLTVQKAIIVSSKRRAEKLEKEAAEAKVCAWEDAKKCVKLAPEWYMGHDRLGAALDAMGKLDEAILSCGLLRRRTRDIPHTTRASFAHL